MFQTGSEPRYSRMLWRERELRILRDATIRRSKSQTKTFQTYRWLLIALEIVAQFPSYFPA